MPFIPGAGFFIRRVIKGVVHGVIDIISDDDKQARQMKRDSSRAINVTGLLISAGTLDPIGLTDSLADGAIDHLTDHATDSFFDNATDHATDFFADRGTDTFFDATESFDLEDYGDDFDLEDSDDFDTDLESDEEYEDFLSEDSEATYYDSDDPSDLPEFPTIFSSDHYPDGSFGEDLRFGGEGCSGHFGYDKYNRELVWKDNNGYYWTENGGKGIREQKKFGEFEEA